MKSVSNIFQWLIFVIIIPLFVLIVVSGTVLYLSGVDVVGKTKEITQSINGTEEIKRMETLLEDTKILLEEKAEAEKKLQKQLEKKDKDITTLKEELASLRKQLQTSNERKKLEEDIIKSFENMAPENAAAILSKAKQEQAVKILRGFNPNNLAQILEKMEPALAAELTKGITE